MADRKAQALRYAAILCVAVLGTAVYGTEFVAIRVAYIRQVEWPHAAFTQTGCVLDGTAAMGNGAVVKRLYLIRRTAFEADRAAVSERRPLAVDWLGDTKSASVMPVKKAGMPGIRFLTYGFACPQCAQHGIVETLGPFEVV